MYTKQHPVNLNSVSTATALAAHDEELTANYQEHQSFATDFAGATPPQFPVLNAKWLDTSTTPPVLKRYNGTAWVAEYIDHAVSADNATKLATPRKINGIPFDGSADINGALSFRNKIINGNFAVNQRAVSGTVTLTAGAYGHDRWKAGASGCTYTFATVANVTTITITAGSLIQIVEGINLQSGTQVLSWQGTAQGKIGSGDYGASGVTGAATGGANLTVEFGTGTLSNVQLEEGSVATEFEQRPFGLELALCQRYYQALDVIFTTLASGGDSGKNVNTVSLKVNMRTTPTLASHPGGGSGGEFYNFGSQTPFGSGTTIIYQGIANSLFAGGYITADAEL